MFKNRSNGEIWSRGREGMGGRDRREGGGGGVRKGRGMGQGEKI